MTYIDNTFAALDSDIFLLHVWLAIGLKRLLSGSAYVSQTRFNAVLELLYFLFA
jgi:hypothetical protein